MPSNITLDSLLYFSKMKYVCIKLTGIVYFGDIKITKSPRFVDSLLNIPSNFIYNYGKEAR